MTHWNQTVLHSDLKDYIVDTNIGQWINHPYINVPLVLGIPMINQMYEQKKELIALSPYNLALYERPYRLLKVIEWAHNDELDQTTIAQKLAWAWIDMEGIDTIDNELIEKGVLPLFNQLNFISDQDNLHLPDNDIYVYRGGEPNGIAWSEKLEIAQWFANRFNNDEPIYKAIASPNYILARLHNRGEYEIIIDPRNLKNIVLVTS